MTTDAAPESAGGALTRNAPPLPTVPTVTNRYRVLQSVTVTLVLGRVCARGRQHANKSSRTACALSRRVL